MGERVPEGVLDIGEKPRLVEELVGLQPSQRATKVVGADVAHLTQQRERDVLPDHRRVLQEPLQLVGQSVDASGEHSLNGRRDAKLIHRTGQAMSAPSAAERVRLAKRPDDLLHEERVTLRALDEEPPERLQGGIRAEQGVHHLVGRFRRKPVDAKKPVVRAPCPAVLIFGPVVDQQ